MRAQGGLIVFIALAMLLVISLLAIITLSPSLRQQDKIKDMRDRQLAALAADSVLNQARSNISRLARKFGAAEVCLHIPCIIRRSSLNNNPDEFPKTSAWELSAIKFRIELDTLIDNEKSVNLASPPIYIVEYLGARKLVIPSLAMPKNVTLHDFRITARGVGLTSDAIKVIETIYSVSD